MKSIILLVLFKVVYTPAAQYFQDLLKLLELYQQAYPNSTPEIEAIANDIRLEFLVEDLSKLIGSMQIGAQLFLTYETSLD